MVLLVTRFAAVLLMHSRVGCFGGCVHHSGSVAYAFVCELLGIGL